MIKATVVAIAAAMTAAAGLIYPTTAAQAAPQHGIHVEDGKIYEANGHELVLRGVNHAHAWFPGNTQAFDDISSLGANSVRTVLSNGVTWNRNSEADVQNVITSAKEADLISVLEVHDTTGYGDTAANEKRSTLAQATDYWIDIKSALIGEEDYVMINIGNEPYGNNNAANSHYVAETKKAIKRLRDEGLHHTLIVDAPGWGQDWQYLMRDNAEEIFASDPDRNVVFSVHMYEVFDTPTKVSNYLESYRAKRLPIIIGEFSSTHFDKPVAWETILTESNRHNVGYFGWSWSGNGAGLEKLDLVRDFSKNSLTPWGQELFNSPHGIAATSRTATVFQEDTPDGDTYPTCTSSASDPDGDGWGWENNRSCRVAPSDTYPTCTSSASDPDGDGWGWENNRSCRVK
ncbi:cellulase family glycosylhydrolase [Jonesia quinghaiensis]|uniref:cellulase family glycosylhydrolase n=1 Tax=Jonesia quinghaiensis TaxID=262806 RepID=UPI00041F7D23|nr:cellulase family glycosylhydrolase [Jonesia quinghaiensis]